MEWIALAIVFCFLMWKWPRKTLIGIGICTGLCVVCGGMLFGIKEYNIYKKNGIMNNISIQIHDKIFNGYRRIAHNKNNDYIALVNNMWIPAEKRPCSLDEIYINMKKENIINDYMYSAYKDAKKRKILDIGENDHYEIYVNNKLYTNSIIEKIDNNCTDDFPIEVSITNNNNIKIYGLKFNISAYIHGRSTNIINESSSVYVIDNILNSGESISLCYQMPSMKEDINRSERFDWRVEIYDVKTEMK